MNRIAVGLVLLSACGDDGGKTPDAPGAQLHLQGEIVDWDETDAVFCGVFGAKLTVHADAALTDSTNPNGRIDMMVPDGAAVAIDVTPPTAASQCASAVGLYQLPGTIIANNAVINSGKFVSYRMIGMDRVAPFFTGLGVTYDATKSLVFVHMEGTHHEITSSATHDTALAFDGSVWAAGATGVNVVFPNSAVGTTAIAAGGAVGELTAPTAAGTFTYVTLVGN